MTLIAHVFPKLRNPKNVVKQISPNSTFSGPLEKQHIKGDQALLKSQPHHPHHVYQSLWRQLTWKKSLLVICEVLRMFVNILTADDKCFLLNQDNLSQSMQMQFPRNKKTFSQFLAAFFKCSLKFEQSFKKITLIANVFPKLRTLKNLLQSISKNSPSGGTIGKQHVRGPKHC